jgi:PPM family protein phosphatase
MVEHSLDGGTVAQDAGTLIVAAATDVGLRRSGNEDSHVLWVGERGREREALGVLLVMADGMGGANAGEVASQLAAAAVLETYRALGAEGPAAALEKAIARANAAVHEQGSQNPAQRGMGTTCTAVAIRGNRLWLGHVGDSRALLVRGDSFRRLTSDHSLVAELVERGHLTPEEALTDSRRNQLTRCVGALPEVQADVMELPEPLLPGDTVVLCSDGLHGLVTEGEIAMIAGDRAPGEACDELIALANERGGPDNITVLIARVTTPDAPRLRPGVIALGIIVLALLVLVAGWAVMRFAGGDMPPGNAPPSADTPAR